VLGGTTDCAPRYREKYRDGTFSITSAGRLAGITGKFRGGDGPPKFEVGCRWLYSPNIS